LVKKIPSPDEWEKEYREGVARKAAKWHKRFLETTGIAAAAASEEAQRAYEAKMSNPEILKLRQKKLAKLSDEDFKAPVRKAGPGIYSTAAQAKSEKAKKGVAPFLDVLRDILPELPPRTDDVDANIDNRVKPIARALHAKKLEGS